jgi:hypothetical protein
MIRGETLIVRAFGGELLVRRVWDITKTLVYIATEEQYEKLASGSWSPSERLELCLEPIGVPAEDVFQYDPKKKIAPAHLVPWRPQEAA